jgi:hypothetical protein
MKKFKVVKLSTMWSTSDLTRNVEQHLQSAHEKSYEIVSVSFGINMWWMPTAYITVAKEEAA